MTLALYPGGYVGTLTFNDGTTNVCGLIKRSSVEPLVWENILSEARRKLPSLDQMLGNAQRTGEWRGVGPLPFSLTMRPGDEIRAGDAAAVGDPYMGEGIGRALAAGPMIAAAWERVKNGARTLENFRLEYRKLWQNHYATRLHFGLWSRRLLGSPFLFDPTMRLLIHSRLLQSFLPIFHGGFHNGRRHTRPDVSYSQL
jgi:flavin-dependent dehydrogenase